jgi:hypothetical protein
MTSARAWGKKKPIGPTPAPREVALMHDRLLAVLVLIGGCGGTNLASVPPAHDLGPAPVACDLTGQRTRELVVLCSGAAAPFDAAVACLRGTEAGTLVFQVEVAEDGSVCRATTLQAELGRDVAECVLEKVTAWRNLRPGRTRYTISRPDPPGCLE